MFTLISEYIKRKKIVPQEMENLIKWRFYMLYLFSGNSYCRLFHEWRSHTCCLPCHFAVFMGRRNRAMAALLFTFWDPPWYWLFTSLFLFLFLLLFCLLFIGVGVGGWGEQGQMRLWTELGYWKTQMVYYHKVSTPIVCTYRLWSNFLKLNPL